MQWLIPLLCTVLAGGGIWTLLAARSTSRATEVAAATAAQSVEEAAAIAAQPQIQQAVTADWGQLMTYWQNEINALRAANAAELSAMRSDSSKLEARILFLESQREDDLNHISDLTQHIWQQLPPPPPPRRATPPQQ